MTIVKATCDDCGEVRLNASEVTVRLNNITMRHAYFFTCPHCSRYIERLAGAGAISLLLSGEVQIINAIGIPQEALEPHVGPAITHDDLIDFHQLLEQDSWYEELQAFLPHSPSGIKAGRFLILELPA